MNKILRLFIILVPLVLTLSLKAAEARINAGIVNFGNVISDSKYGKHEKESFENLEKQMTSLLEDTKNQLNDIASKFNDPEYLDGLSPDGETELKNKFQTLNEEFQRYQNQYYQVMNQANMRLYQIMTNHINDAAIKLAKKQKLAYVINKDACFYYDPKLDVTTSIIEEMDALFDVDENIKKSVSQKKPDEGNKSSPKKDVEKGD